MCCYYCYIKQLENWLAMNDIMQKTLYTHITLKSLKCFFSLTMWNIFMRSYKISIKKKKKENCKCFCKAQCTEKILLQFIRVCQRCWSRESSIPQKNSLVLYLTTRMKESSLKQRWQVIKQITIIGTTVSTLNHRANVCPKFFQLHENKEIKHVNWPHKNVRFIKNKDNINSSKHSLTPVLCQLHLNYTFIGYKQLNTHSPSCRPSPMPYLVFMNPPTIMHLFLTNRKSLKVDWTILTIFIMKV